MSGLLICKFSSSPGFVDGIIERGAGHRLLLIRTPVPVNQELGIFGTVARVPQLLLFRAGTKEKICIKHTYNQANTECVALQHFWGFAAAGSSVQHRAQRLLISGAVLL